MATEFLRQVRQRMPGAGYGDFMALHRDFLHDRIDAPGLVDAIDRLFKHQRDLARGFRSLVPGLERLVREQPERERDSQSEQPATRREQEAGPGPVAVKKRKLSGAALARHRLAERRRQLLKLGIDPATVPVGSLSDYAYKEPPAEDPAPVVALKKPRIEIDASQLQTTAGPSSSTPRSLTASPAPVSDSSARRAPPTLSAPPPIAACTSCGTTDSEEWLRGNGHDLFCATCVPSGKSATGSAGKGAAGKGGGAAGKGGGATGKDAGAASNGTTASGKGAAGKGAGGSGKGTSAGGKAAGSVKQGRKTPSIDSSSNGLNSTGNGSASPSTLQQRRFIKTASDLVRFAARASIAGCDISDDETFEGSPDLQFPPIASPSTSAVSALLSVANASVDTGLTTGSNPSPRQQEASDLERHHMTGQEVVEPVA